MKKLLMVLMVIILILVSVSLVNSLSYELTYNDNETIEYTIDSPNGLWTSINKIENRHEFDGHQLIELVRDINDLKPSENIYPGQVIEVPVRVMKN